MYEIRIYVPSIRGIKIKEWYGIDRRKDKDAAMERWVQLKDEYEEFNIELVEWVDDEGKRANVLERHWAD